MKIFSNKIYGIFFDHITVNSLKIIILKVKVNLMAALLFTQPSLKKILI